MAATKFAATMPDGTVATRTSKTRHYTWAVAFIDSRGTWLVYRWSSTYALASKAARELSWPGIKQVQIIEATS